MGRIPAPGPPGRTTVESMPQHDLVDDFKAAFRDHPAAVTIITAMTDDGPAGLTASSVSSVAVDPPSLSFSVTRATGSAGALLGAHELQVHFLTPAHADVAMSFARSGSERFTAAQGWDLTDGTPRLAGVRARLTGRIEGMMPVGSSTLAVLEVTGVEPGVEAEPLLYADRTFLRLGEKLG